MGFNFTKTMVIALLLSNNFFQNESNALKIDIEKHYINDMYALNQADLHINSDSKLHSTAALFSSLESKLSSA